MWPETFEQRLAEWSNLKRLCESQDLETVCSLVNDWWFRAPIVNHYIHRQDIPNWPDPWQLLNDNIYCDLARALGIVYTLMDIKFPGIQTISLGYTENDNLVLVNEGLYILNWAPRTVLNIQSQEFNIKKTISSEQLQEKYN